MNNFTYSIPTVIHFGREQLSHLSELKQSGDRVLLVYGGGSIKKSGLYDEAMRILTEAGLTVTELSGVEPNPRIESVRKGAELCRENNIDMVLAVGGGSSIDCAKVIAAGACYDGDPWDLVLDGGKIKAALPVYSVLTLSATGSEMDEFAVISDLTKNEKWGTGSPLVKPVMSVLDPSYTFTVSPKQTAAGTADMMSHTFENYFTNVKGAYLQASLCEAVLKTCIKYGPIALNDPENYEARANLMWAGSLAINGLLSGGAEVGWCVHPMEHELSAFYDITHGEGLAILTPVWMKFVLKKDPSKTAQLAAYGRNVWGLDGDDTAVAESAIDKTAEFFFKTMKMPANLRAVGITEKVHFEEMAKKAAAGSEGSFVPLTAEDIVSIFEAAF
ncbi:MAG: iron-containing alcohol dehydrogenase [Oscillospiraceae bacterium]|nr:iron-containing alcohol dehydrogenase [Oscillospiraceae bacterium]